MNTIAQKCRNPLNIRASVKNNWLGSRGQYKGFVVFNSSRMGYRAALLLLRNYIRSGHNTIRSIITRWAPPSENDTEKYIETVSSSLGVLPDAEITNDIGLCSVCDAMARVESGIDGPGIDYLYGLCIDYRIFVKPSEYKTIYGKREKISLD